MKEIYRITFEGHEIEFHCDHADADQILAQAGWKVPTIPDGCNTVVCFLETREKLQALVLNQRGFAPTAQDNERQLNGCTVMVCLDRTLDLIDARQILKRCREAIENT